LLGLRFARGWTWAAALLVLCATAAPAGASFPGRNGAIVYGWTDAQKYSASPTSLRIVDPRTGRVRVLRDCPLRSGAVMPYSDCFVQAPRYSPDGQRIAFASALIVPAPLGQPWDVRQGVGLMAWDGTSFEQHTSATGYWRLAWSPAGDRLLLQRERAAGFPNPPAIFLALVDGTELMQATPDWAQEPDWASTGEIAFGGFDDPSCFPTCGDIFATRLGGTPRRLTYRGGASPSWSPHGTKLAFVRSNRRQPDVYLVGRDGRGLRRLTRKGGYSPSWSPDGKWIAFVRDGDLYVVRTNGRGLRRLVNGTIDAEYGLGPQVKSLDWRALPRRE
jgi:TolB protein